MYCFIGPPTSTNPAVAMENARLYAVEQAIADGVYGEEDVNNLDISTVIRRGRVVVTIKPC